MESWSGASLGPKPRSFGWRDAMDIIVKWRQLSEPNDQVSFGMFIQDKVLLTFGRTWS